MQNTREAKENKTYGEESERNELWTKQNKIKKD